MAEQPALGFAGLLRQLRAEARLTQEELAEAARLSPRSVSDLERGINRTARKDTALLLADALGLIEPVRAVFVAAARGRVPAAEVLAAMPGKARAASPAAAGGVHGFPPVLTSFVGRAGAVSEIAGLLDQYRLVTVTGPGGAGKTRLAGVVAKLVAGRFADGVWLAELAAVLDPAMVAPAVATALGVREQAGGPTANVLAQVLARRQLLLVLDNCEHVIEAAAGLCAGLLARSREAGDPWNEARLLTRMTILDLRTARIEDAAAHLRESLQIAARTGGQFELQNGLDCCGYLCAATGRFAEAVTVWAAHAAIFRHEGYAYPPAEARRQQESLRKARQALGPARARAAEERGAAMSLDTVAEYALMLTAPGAQPPAAALGLGKLSAWERELVTLVAQGRTDTQIAAQLFISVRTVSAHLDRVRDKTGCRRRADLTSLALSAGLV